MERLPAIVIERLMGLLRFALIVVLAAAPAGCQTNPATGRRQLLLLTDQESFAMGNQAMPALIEEYGGEIPSARIRDYVAGVGSGVAQRTESDYQSVPWEFTALDSDAINAFALPGGKVFITRGLMARLDDEAQLAAVLGHEVGHVTGRHVNERISQAMIIQGVSVAAAGAAGQSDSRWAAVVPLVVGLGGQGYLLKFGRDQEAEADEQGVKYMVGAGYDPQGMVGVLEVLAETAAASGGQPPEFLSTHPHPETRLKTVSALLAGPYQHTQGDAAFRTYPGRYREEVLDQLPAPVAASAPSAWCGLCRAEP